MEKLCIPSSPNWYEVDVMACTPDNTLLYGSRQDLVIIKPTPTHLPDDVQIIAKAHSSRITSVNVNRNWGAPHKYAVTLSEHDKCIKLWDVETLTKKLSHNKHNSVVENGTKDPKVIGVCFAGDDRVVSASRKGTVVVWNINTDETTVISSLFNNKMELTYLSVCPHATWLAAFGLVSGLIVVADLRRSGKVLYTLRGHSKPIVSLAWCPAPVNIFPTKPHNRVVEKKTETTEDKIKIPDVSTTIHESSGISEKIVVHRRKQPDPKKQTLPSTGENVPKTAEKEDKDEELLLDDSKFLKMILKVGEKPRRSDPGNGESLKSPDVATTKSKRCTISVSDLLAKKEQDVQTCSLGEIQPLTTMVVPTLEAAKLDVSGSTEETFSSASSCENILGCSKRTKESLNLEETKKSGSCSDSGEVFHDASSEEGSAAAASKVAGAETAEKVKNWRTKIIPKKVVTGGEGEAEVENWRTEEPVGVDEQPRKEFLLASSARETNIYIWRAGTDGRMQTFMTVPVPKTPKNSKKRKSETEKHWITLCWVTPTTLLSSSRTAELLQWTLPKPLLQSKFLRTIHKSHWSALFSIKAPIIYTNENNFLQERKLNVWTTGMDRMVVNSDVVSGQMIGCLSALGGSANCLAGSPLDPCRLAIGSGEALIGLWDLGRPDKKIIFFNTFYQKVCSSVTALAWHPIIEGSLAWGTEEGRVGLFEVSGKNKQPKILPHFFKSQIFKMEWGPVDGATGDKKLFVVSESKVAIFDPQDPNETDPEMLQLPDNTHVYTIAWKPCETMLLVSTKTGTLLTYSPDLLIANISYLSNKLQTILWHPDAASNDEETFKYCKTFVSVVKFNELAVYDLSVESENIEDRLLVHFENGGVKINSVAWSPHTKNHLVLVDDGAVAKVFDIESKTVISTYLNPWLDPLLSVYWSPVDPDHVLVGTMSHRIIVYSMSQHAALTDEELKTQKNKITKAQQKETNDLVSKEKTDACAVDIAKGKLPPKKPPPKSPIVPMFFAFRDKTQLQDMHKLLQYKLGNKDVEPTVGDGKHIDILDVFGKEGKMEKVFDINLNAFKHQGKVQQANLLTLFQGDIGASIKDAIEKKRVNPWIISVSPMVSPKLWQAACETYAQQLIDEPDADPMEVATYLLVCHKVVEAVQFLCERQHFREALVLTKARFGADNAMLFDILSQWAKHSMFQGNFELAACCYITLDKYGEAASVLFRRSTPDALKMAAHLAQLDGNEALIKAVKFRLDAFTDKVEDNAEDVETPPSDNESQNILKQNNDCVNNLLGEEKAINVNGEEDQHENVQMEKVSVQIVEQKSKQNEDSTVTGKKTELGSEIVGTKCQLEAQVSDTSINLTVGSRDTGETEIEAGIKVENNEVIAASKEKEIDVAVVMEKEGKTKEEEVHVD